jgi:hypothetical protein
MAQTVENDSLKITEIAPSRYGILSKVFGVYVKPTGDSVGRIVFDGYSKSYVFKPSVETGWRPEALDFISTFLKSLVEGKA